MREAKFENHRLKFAESHTVEAAKSDRSGKAIAMTVRVANIDCETATGSRSSTVASEVAAKTCNIGWMRPASQN